MFHHSIYELRHIYGDVFYQLYRRLGRISDPFHVYGLPAILSGLYLLSGQHFCFKVRKSKNFILLEYFINSVKYIVLFLLHDVRFDCQNPFQN